MSKITININEKHFEAEEGMTVLEVLKQNNIKVPTLCYHKALRPIGACKLCSVEVKGRTEKPRILLSCILKAKDGLEVRTEGPLVQKARENAMRNLLSRAPQAEILLRIAKQHNISTGPIPDGCLRCRLCIRVCKEVVGAGALKMEKREGMSLVVPTEALCIGCGTCAKRFLAHVSDHTRPHVDVKEHHKYCPTCSKLFSDRARSSSRFKRI